jgi:glycosyltransferase involved in cell wall biosynthesis
MNRAPQPTIWVDIDDLLHYLAHHSRPSGIQRVTYEICLALHHRDRGAGRVGFVRRIGGSRDIVTVHWYHIEAAYRRVANPPAVARAPIRSEPKAAEVPDTLPERAPELVSSRPTPPEALRLLANAMASQIKAVAMILALPLFLIGHAFQAARRGTRARHEAWRHRRAARRHVDHRPEAQPTDGKPLKSVAKPGDTLIVLGSPWHHSDYAKTIRFARDELRMRFALLVHDLIPVRRPEWCDRGVITTFTDWHRSILPFADQIFTNSRATAADVTRWLGETDVPSHNPVQPVPMGTGLINPSDWGAPNSAGLPEPGTYALFVSTLEARKNHALLFRVWRRLLTELPPDEVPTLVFAGRVGWLVSDFMQQLENAKWLNGKIHHVSDPTDAELMALYRGCQFTLFPSLFEGWGLPVSESLALGRPCLVSRRTSLPEAGGDLARYFDPENFDDAYRVIRDTIVDPRGLELWRQRVVREFRHVPWEQTADVIRETLDGDGARRSIALT